MITLDNDTLVLDRTQDGDDILPLVHPGKGGKGGGWFVDLGIENQDVLNVLLDAEILDESVSIRYIARNGQEAEGTAHIEELISGPDGHLCRLRGDGPPPPAVLADEPKTV
ncbi:MAG: hypothetical protein ACYDCO_23135 [Armatimonadota bacterium]